MKNRKATPLIGLLATLWMLSASALAQAQAPPTLPPELEKVRSALMKYQDPLVAIREGYFSTLGCVELPFKGFYKHQEARFTRGGMGIHFLNIKLVSPVPDPMKPPVLLYEPVGDKLVLVGAEWFVPLATGIKERPQIFGQPFNGAMEGHFPLMPKELRHYDLHVWLFKANPAGLFHPINPDVKCRGYSHTFNLEPPDPVKHP